MYRRIHRTIKKVTEDVGERYHFNTAISAIMELMNAINEYPEDADRGTLAEALETAVILLAPFVPHLTEELWRAMGHETSVHEQPWPSYDPEMLVEEEVEMAVQINGRVRDKLVVPVTADRETVEQLALNQERIKNHLSGKTVRKVIVVPKKLVNIVAN